MEQLRFEANHKHNEKLIHLAVIDIIIIIIFKLIQRFFVLILFIKRLKQNSEYLMNLILLIWQLQ